MNSTSDFIILRTGSDGANWFWDGRGGWTNALRDARIYADLNAVQAACARLKRKGKLPAGAGYMTVDEFANEELCHAQEQS